MGTVIHRRERADRARGELAFAGQLDLDDVSSQFTQQAGARKNGAEIRVPTSIDENAGQRPGQRGQLTPGGPGFRARP